MTIKELQDDINVRLQQFDGRKCTGAGSIPKYHKWYEGAIMEELEKNGVVIFHLITWRIIAEIDGHGEVRIHDAEVAKIELDAKRTVAINTEAQGPLTRSVSISE